MTPAIRPAAVAGSFYPDDPATLHEVVGRHLAHARPAPEGAACPKLLVVPHAGYVYSGDIAASAYRWLAPHRGRITRVVLLGPVHRVPVRGLARPSAERFATPLGEVPLDHEALARLDDLPQVVVSDRAHAWEHALEVQLPFLQTVLGTGWRLVPLAVGDAAPHEVDAVLERLWGGPETLIVVSSDLSHYLAPDEARQRDHATAARLLHFATDLRGDEACGARALNGAMRCARRHGLRPQLLDLRHSGDTGGRGHPHVVGYGALAFTAAADDGATTNQAINQANGQVTGAVDGRVEHTPSTAGTAMAVPAVTPLPDASRDPALGRALLRAARRAIAERLGLGTPSTDEADAREPAALQRPGACFVTLHDGAGALRGCIGHLQAERPLADDVWHNAQAAAFEDPRFAPLRADEWPTLSVEVSVLGPMQPLPPAATLAQAAAALVPGRDGVMLTGHGRRATFLPQVWDQLPQPVAFLQRLLAKAGLASIGWSPEIRLARYTVQAYADTDPDLHDGGPHARRHP